MLVKAVKNFVGIFKGRTYAVNVGQELELPEGVDWVRAGLVVPVREDEQEMAVEEAEVEAVEMAVAEKPRITRRKAPASTGSGRTTTKKKAGS